MSKRKCRNCGRLIVSRVNAWGRCPKCKTTFPTLSYTQKVTAIISVVVILIVLANLDNPMFQFGTYAPDRWLQKYDDLYLTELVHRRDDLGFLHITGAVFNGSSYEKDYIQIEITLKNQDGEVVGSTMDNVTNVESQETWRFEAITSRDEAYSYEVKEITGF